MNGVVHLQCNAVESYTLIRYYKDNNLLLFVFVNMIRFLPGALLFALRSCLCCTCGLLWYLASICSQTSCSSAKSLTMRLARMLLLAGLESVYSGNRKQLPVCPWPVANRFLMEVRLYIALKTLQKKMQCCLLDNKARCLKKPQLNRTVWALVLVFNSALGSFSSSGICIEVWN